MCSGDKGPRRAHRRRRNLLIRLAEQQENRCFHCQGELVLLASGVRYAGNTEETNRPDLASIEHLTPRSLGGTNRIENFVVAHRQCNSMRGSRMPTEDELARLAVLNERRGFLISEVRPFMEASTFGIETPASLYLIDLLSALEGREAAVARRRVAQILTLFNQDMAAIEPIKVQGIWDRIAKLVFDEHIRRSQVLDGDIGTTVRSVMRTIYNDRRQRKGVAAPPRPPKVQKAA